MKNFSDQKGKGRKAGDESSGGDGTTSNHSQEVKRKILVVGKDYAFSNGVVDYAANLSQRLGYDIIAMSVNPALGQSGKFFSPYNQHLRGKFTQRAQEAWVPVASELASQGIRSEHVVKFEGLSGAIKDLNHEVKRIDFVITDSGIKDEEITGEIPLPVFSISGYQGEKVMAQEHHETAHRGKLITQDHWFRGGFRGPLCRSVYQFRPHHDLFYQGRHLCGAAHCHGVRLLLCVRSLYL